MHSGCCIRACSTPFTVNQYPTVTSEWEENKGYAIVKNPAVIPVAAVKHSRNAASNIKLLISTWKRRRSRLWQRGRLHLKWVHWAYSVCIHYWLTVRILVSSYGTAPIVMNFQYKQPSIILWLLKHLTAVIIINVITDLLLYIGRLIKAEEDNTSVELTIITFTSGMQQSASGIVHRCIKSIKYKISQVDCQLHWASSSVFNHTGHFMYFFSLSFYPVGSWVTVWKSRCKKTLFASIQYLRI